MRNYFLADGFHVPYQLNYNLNSPPRSEADAASSLTNSFQFAPVTPEQAKQLENRRLSEIINFSVDDSSIVEKDKQENLVASIRNEGIENHCDEILHKIVDPSSVAISTWLKEKDNANEDYDQGIDLNKTPQQKPPKRRKHRPKVVIEGKPKRTPKPTTPKNSNSKDNPSGKRMYVWKKGLTTAVSQQEDVMNGLTVPTAESANGTSKENSSGKRKYVRKKGLKAAATKQEVAIDGVTVSTVKSANSTYKENPSGKRKYVRKKSLKAAATQQEGAFDEDTVPTVEYTTKSCRRMLNFDLENKMRDESHDRPASHQVEMHQVSRGAFKLNFEPQTTKTCMGLNSISRTKSALQTEQQNGYTMDNQQMGTACNLAHSTDQRPAECRYLPEQHVPTAPPAVANSLTLNIIARNVSMKNANPSQNSEGRSYNKVPERIHKEGIGQIVFQENTTRANLERTRELVLQGTAQVAAEDTTSDEKRGSKRKYYHGFEQMYPLNMTGSTLLQGMFQAGDCNSDDCNFGTGCTKDHKKKKTENMPSSITTVKDCSRQVETRGMSGFQASSSTSHITSGIFNSYFERTKVNNGIKGTAGDCYVHPIAGSHDFQKRHVASDLQSHAEGSAENKSQQSTQVHDLSPTTPQRVPPSDYVQGIEIFHASESTKGQTATPNSFIQPSSTVAKALRQEHKDAFYQQFSIKEIGSMSKQKCLVSIDEITNQLQSLIISSGVNAIVGQEQKAIVPYKEDGTIVPYESFDPIKKRKPRPKVDLDPETNRIWKLLMGKEGSEGTEATHKDKEKWWEEERKVFRGRADSFIARMHLVQGDRRFSQWKGSVVDSVIGVFLTQNVSDHLSSSAFMSLAAKFPLRSATTKQTCNQRGRCIVVEEPEVQIVGSDGCNRSHEHVTRQPVFPNFITCGGTNNIPSGEGTYLENEHNSRAEEEIISSQRSSDSSILQTTDETRSSSGSNSEAEDQTTGSKFNENHGPTPISLLQTEKNPVYKGLYSHVMGRSLVDPRSTRRHQQSENPNCNRQSRLDRVNNMKGSSAFTYPINSSILHMQGSNLSSSNLQLNIMPTSGVLKVGWSGVLVEESISSLSSTDSGISKAKGVDQMSKRMEHMVESTNKTIAEQNADPRIQVPPVGPFASLSKHCTQKENNLQPGAYTQHSFNNHQERSKALQLESMFVTKPVSAAEALAKRLRYTGQQVSDGRIFTGQTFDVQRISVVDKQFLESKPTEANAKEQIHPSDEQYSGTGTNITNARKGKDEGEKRKAFDWDSLRKQVQLNGKRRERSKDTMDSLNYEAVRCADVAEISNAIKERGMNNMLAERIKDFLNRLVREHGSLDLEWLRDIPPDKAKDYLLSVRGLGLKSVECVRLLTLHQLAFPVDTNVGRIAVRLGWVPLQPLPESLQLHLLELYPMLESIQKYLWPRLCKLDQHTLYELHYQMITFGKVFCTKSKPNCNACPMRGECRHFASAFASARLALPGPEERNIVSSAVPIADDRNSAAVIKPMPLPPAENNSPKQAGIINGKCEPIVEEPTTPEPETTEVLESDIEDAFYEDPDEIPTIKLNIEEFTLNLHNYMQENNMELQEGDMSKALVALNPEATSIPTPKLKNVSRLRTEHQVYELPDSHPLLKGLDKREPDDPSPYLLAIWTPGETANSFQLPERRCGSQESGQLCNDKTCFSCNSIREANSQTVRGTFLIPCRTAMRGSFPLNGTYFQVNEVFSDHESSLNPIDVPRAWIWNLPRRTVYFGTTVSTIFKGLSTEGIQYCFWRGFVCVRGFDQETRAPRPLMARLHFPASKLVKSKNDGK